LDDKELCFLYKVGRSRTENLTGFFQNDKNVSKITVHRNPHEQLC